MNETMSNPLVSAIITTHNRKKSAERAIECVLGQTYKNIECIVIDDKSCDGTEEYLKNKFGDRIKYQYIPPEKSKGGNHARNVGISLAQGKYIAFLDDDDIWLKEKVSKQVSLLEKAKEYSMVYCLRYFCYDNQYCWTEGMDSDCIGDVSKIVFKKIITSTSTMMFTSESIKTIGGFDEKLSCWQETELMMRFAQLYKVGCVEEQLILYTVDISDPERLSNKFDNWEESIRYIEHKHENLMSVFSQAEKNDWEYMKYRDAISRAGTKKQLNYFYNIIYKLKPSKSLWLKKLLKYKAASKGNLTIRKFLAIRRIAGHFLKEDIGEKLPAINDAALMD